MSSPASQGSPCADPKDHFLPGLTAKKAVLPLDERCVCLSAPPENFKLGQVSLLASATGELRVPPLMFTELDGVHI